MEKRRSPLVSIPPLRGGDFQGMRVYRPMVFLLAQCTARENCGLDEPARLSLGMVASLQCPPPFHPAGSL